MEKELPLLVDGKLFTQSMIDELAKKYQETNHNQSENPNEDIAKWIAENCPMVEFYISKLCEDYEAQGRPQIDYETRFNIIKYCYQVYIRVRFLMVEKQDFYHTEENGILKLNTIPILLPQKDFIIETEIPCEVIKQFKGADE